MEETTGLSSRKVGRAIAGALIAALLIKIFVLDLMIADGYSMAPAIEPGRVLLVCKLFYGIRLPGSDGYLIQWRDPQVGEILVFYTPHGETAVKRCAEILPDDYFWALGDNSEMSYDSRNYGAVPNRNIIGKVLGIR